MIIDHLQNANRYVSLNPRFPAAFRYLENLTPRELIVERVEIEGDKLYAMMSFKPGKKKEEAKLEAHRKYIDIQYIVSGTESMAWKPQRSCMSIRSPYDETKDVILYDDEPSTWCSVHPGSVAIFFPEDAHAPMVSEGKIHKIVLKVAA